MQTAALRAIGREDDYTAVSVPEGDVADALDHLRSLGYLGVNVTVPHKSSALEWSQKPDEISQRIGAVNTLRMNSGEGTNTDAPGLIQSWTELGMPSVGRALIIGAGGSAGAAFAALDELGWEIFGFNRTRSRLEALLDSLQVKGTVLDRPMAAGMDLVIDATSAALHGEGLEVDWADVKSSALVYSLMYRPGGPMEIPILADAASRGLRVADGRLLLASQGVLSLRYWLPELTQNEMGTALKAMKKSLGLELNP